MQLPKLSPNLHRYHILHLPLTQSTYHPWRCLGECWGIPTLNIGPEPMHFNCTPPCLTWSHTKRMYPFAEWGWPSAHMTALTYPLLRVTLPGPHISYRMQQSGRAGGRHTSALKIVHCTSWLSAKLVLQMRRYYVEIPATHAHTNTHSHTNSSRNLEC